MIPSLLTIVIFVLHAVHASASIEPASSAALCATKLLCCEAIDPVCISIIRLHLDNPI